MLSQLQIISAYPDSSAVVRVPSSDPVTIKQYLDIGAQSILVPMVGSAAEAGSIVDACRYPPQGTRGIGGARGARWGRYPNYLAEANHQIAIVVQAESREAIANLESICAVDGIDGILIGPADLAASLGFPGQPGCQEVQDVITGAIRTVRSSGIAVGILTRDETLARQQLELGASFVAVGVDTLILAAQTTQLAARFQSGTGAE